MKNKNNDDDDGNGNGNGNGLPFTKYFSGEKNRTEDDTTRIFPLGRDCNCIQIY